jgi:hypothetical protein
MSQIKSIINNYFGSNNVDYNNNYQYLIKDDDDDDYYYNSFDNDDDDNDNCDDLENMLMDELEFEHDLNAFRNTVICD